MYHASLKVILALVGLAMISAITPSFAADPALQKFVGAKPETFAEPDQALEALKQGLDKADVEGLAKLLGLNVDAARKSEDFDQRLVELQQAAKQKAALEDEEDGSKDVILGDLAWPFPFPLVQEGNRWQFDTLRGLEEVLARRVGENELEAIRTLENYLIAQMAYALQDRDGDSVKEFAQQVISDEGTRNGLYWPATDGEESPAGSFGDPGKVQGSAATDHGYYGYRFRILKSQGSNIAGGKYDYVINGNMIAGHALIAWPAIYGETGIMTFVLSHQGIIYEKDFGRATDRAVKEIRSFNPDKSWEPVEE
jgi:hypothetical protein